MQGSPTSLQLCATILVAYLSVGLAARCEGESKPGPPNMKPIDKHPPVLKETVKHGKLFIVGNGEDAVDLLHLYGSPYEMGYAHGTLLKEKLLSFYPKVETYLAEQITKKAAKHPVFKWILEDSDPTPTPTLTPTPKLQQQQKKHIPSTKLFDETVLVPGWHQHRLGP